MAVSQRDISAIEHIIKYCDEIEQALTRFGKELKTLQNDSVFKNAMAMCVLQIGELTTHFSKEFSKEYDKINWKEIKTMRNIAAHNYGIFSAKVLHKTMIEDIPKLKTYCEDILKQTLKSENDKNYK
ncbi:MAG: DUF86 domain-containing protein [Chitinivibrionia bacterium]|nr:DUF86 domain-containing protein [Chitinivibrionia bacterium]